MKLNTTLVALALALGGGAASAATVGTLYDAVTGAPLANDADLPPLLYTAVQTDTVPNYSASFDYVYNFKLDTTGNLDVSANTYEGPVVDGSASFAIYSGTSTGASGTPGTEVGSLFSFGSSIASTTFNLNSGSYFFEVTGAPATAIGTAFNVTIQAPSETGPLPAIPEPTNMALLLAGLGLMGFMVKRRSQQ